ncbi:glycosyltransferase family 2 protein [Sinomonas sp. P47F7]|uniref:glycosyltransferase family 2 protein n=1 Tax=Sinomonas sp. P47F7 TaxID=3410987 RepID=UPI003BF5638B
MIVVVVVVYKAFSDLNTCLRSLRAGPASRVVVVDNSFHSAGSCVDHVANWDSDRFVHVVPHDNLGYARGNNLGIQHALDLGADFVIVCNPDVIIMPPVIDRLVSEIERGSYGLISPFLVEGTLGSTERPPSLSRPGWDLALGRGVISTNASEWASRLYPTFFGACFIVKSDVVRHVGGLCEDFFLYCEEADYCQRLAQHEIRWAISPEVGVEHNRGASISDGSTRGKSLIGLHHAARSMVILGRRYWPSRSVVWTVLRIALSILYLARGRPDSARAILTGLLSGWRADVSKRIAPRFS